MPLELRFAAWTNTILLWVPILAQAAPSSGGAGGPFSNDWVNFGLLGLLIVAIIYLKVLVPGWVYQAEVERSKQKDVVIAAKDTEIARLRDLMENQTIPMLQRALVIVERAEDEWKVQQFRREAQGGGQPPPSMPSGPPSPSA